MWWRIPRGQRLSSSLSCTRLLVKLFVLLSSLVSRSCPFAFLLAFFFLSTVCPYDACSPDVPDFHPSRHFLRTNQILFQIHPCRISSPNIKWREIIYFSFFVLRTNTELVSISPPGSPHPTPNNEYRSAVYRSNTDGLLLGLLPPLPEPPDQHYSAPLSLCLSPSSLALLSPF